MGSGLLDLGTAQHGLLHLLPAMPVEPVSVDDALGRYCAEPVMAQRTQPPADLSAMDGFAVAGDGPWTIVGESRCGAPFAGELAPNEATFVSTGAVMPGGADAVLIKENAEVEGRNLSATTPPASGRHIRREGFDFRSGDEILPAGARIGAAELALLLGGGCRTMVTARKPQLAIFETGDELLIDPKGDATSAIPASNGAMLAAMCAGEPCIARRHAPLPDRLDDIASALQAANEADLVVISGGASVGDHDLVRPALERIGAKIAFWKVAMKPGKPLMVATRGSQVILGLPGNPVSSFVTGMLFMLPAVRRLCGSANPMPVKLPVFAAEDLPPVGTRMEFLRGTIDADGGRPLLQQDSSGLGALAQANCLIERPAGCAGVKAGTVVPVYPLGNGRTA